MTPVQAPPQPPPMAVPVPPPAESAEPARPGRVSRYLDHLPAIYQSGEDGGPNYLGRFLLAFEDVLTGEGTAAGPSLDAAITSLRDLFVPLGGGGRKNQAPPEFLDWLARWVAISLRADLDVEQRRRFIAHAVPTYRWRGTRRGLREAVRLYTGAEPEITEPTSVLQVGVNTRVGSAIVGGGHPHTFEVRIRLSDTQTRSLGQQGAAERLRRAHEVVSAIIEHSKPAHTIATLVVEAPTFQIGIRSTIGLDSLLSSDEPRG